MTAPEAGAAGRIVVVGSLNADLTIYCERLPLPGETVHGNGFAVNPGGKSANQAVAASLLGADVHLVGAVGDDSNGQMLLSSAAGAGVHVGHVRTAPAETGVAVIAVDVNGENNIIISAGANGTLSPADVAAAADVLAGAAVVCLCLEVSLETVLASAQAGHDAGATVVLNLSPYAEIPQQLADLTDVLLVNAHEASQLLGSALIPGSDGDASDWEAVRARFAERGLQQVIVTLGAHGSVVLDSLAAAGQQLVQIAPITVKAMDTTGAGDAFTGAVAARLAAGASLADAAAFASIAAALATTRKGTQAAYPAEDDVKRVLASGTV